MWFFSTGLMSTPNTPDIDWLPKIGVEEEYQLVDPQSGGLIPNCKEVMSAIRTEPDGEVQHELHLSQIEMASDTCETLADVRESLRNVRGILIAAARRTGAELVAAGTNPMPLPAESDVTPKDRYEQMADRYQQIARELFIFGCHVHVSMPDRGLGIDVMNRSLRWLPLLQAISANSPYWDGKDTGYMSYRRELWTQWPMAGPPPYFQSVGDYQQCIDDLLRCGAVKDESFLYWDIRLPTRIPTIEFRCADVMTSLEETVGFAGLVRGIVTQSISDIRAGTTARPIRTSVLRYAMWQAARFGVGGQLVDPETCDALPVADLVERLRRHVRPALQRSGDAAVVDQFLDGVVRDGCGASKQRHDTPQLTDVVTELIARTEDGTHRQVHA